MAYLSLKDINKIYPNGFHAVHDFNLEIEKGEFIVFVGPSGCGKSTTLRMIAGLEDISKGDFLIDGVRANEKGPRDRGIAMVFQSYALYPQMTVYDNLAFGLTLQGIDEDIIEKKVKNVAGILGLTDYLDRLPKALSGGQRQRVAVGRAIIRKVGIFLMDEPLSNLDAKLRMEMRTELKRLHRETGATFVYVTHDQLEAMTLATKICLLDKGVLQQYAPPLTVYNKPANTFVADFVGSPTINFLKCKNEGNGVLSSPIGKVKFNRVDGAMVDVGENPTIGIRPEFVTMDKNGKLEGEVLSSLPSGMETTLRLKVKDYVFSSVLFGSLDFKVGEKLPLSLPGETIVLFDSNGNYSGEGSLEIL